MRRYHLIRSLVQCGSTRLALLLAVAATVMASSTAWAQLPTARLYSVFPSGGRPDSTVEVTLTGADLDEVDRLQFSHDGITAVQKTREPGIFEKGPQPVDNQFQVKIGKDVPPGLYEARAIGRYGISNPRVFMVSASEQLQETEPNNTPEQATEVPLDTVVFGRADSTNYDYFKFEAKSGQRVILDLYGERLDSRIDAVLKVYDTSGDELERNRYTNGADPLVDFTAPADGVYIAELFDFTFGGGNDYFYRLSISTGPYIDFIMPPVGKPGSNDSYTVYGRNLPGGKLTKDVKVHGKLLEELTVKIQLPSGDEARQLDINSLVAAATSSVDGTGYRLRSPSGVFSNSQLICFAESEIISEKEPNNKPDVAQKVSLPCDFVGQFNRPGDVDWIVFDAKKGDTHWIEIFSQRFGLPTDPYCVIQRVTVDDKGEEKVSDVQQLDDVTTNAGGNTYKTATDDAVYRFVAPADAQYRVAIRDLYYNGDPRYVYRLSIKPASPDFRLVTVPKFPTNSTQVTDVWNPLLRRGDTEVIDVVAFRRDGFDGEIEVSIEGLPKGLECPPTVIGPGSSSASLVVKAAEDAADWVGTIKVVGKAKIDDAEVTRIARGGTAIWKPAVNNTPAPARMTRDFTLAVTSKETAAFLVEAGEGKTWEMSRAGVLKIPVKMTRRDNFKGNVALTGQNLPSNTQGKNLSLNGTNTDGEFELTLRNNAPIGEYTIYLLASSQVPYQRNADGAKAAEERKKEIDKLAAEADAASKKAAADKTAADKAATDAAAEAKKAADAKTAADKALADAKKAAKDATDKAEAAAKAVAEKPEDKGLADAKAAADKAADEAAGKAEEAKTAQAAAEKAAAEAAESAKKAAEAKTTADKAATESAARAKAAAAAKAAATKRATDMANAAKSRNTNVYQGSTAIRVKITEGPIVLKPAKPDGKLKQGEKQEVTVAIDRLYDFKDAVPLTLQLPGGVSGLKASNVSIDKEKNEAKLVIEAAANATPGDHELTVRATPRFNNQTLTLNATVSISVEAVEAEKK